MYSYSLFISLVHPSTIFAYLKEYRVPRDEFNLAGSDDDVDDGPREQQKYIAVSLFVAFVFLLEVRFLPACPCQKTPICRVLRSTNKVSRKMNFEF